MLEMQLVKNKHFRNKAPVAFRAAIIGDVSMQHAGDATGKNQHLRNKTPFTVTKVYRNFMRQKIINLHYTQLPLKPLGCENKSGAYIFLVS